MAGKLQLELKKRDPFDCLEQEAGLNIIRTADHLGRCFHDLMKSSGLSESQYNVLRILRGVGPDGLPCSEIAERMISRDPDVTRLLDRLEKAGLIVRQRSTSDRRVVRSRITEAGLSLLKPLDDVVLDLHRRQLSHLGPEKLRQLIDLLELAREPPGPAG